MRIAIGPALAVLLAIAAQAPASAHEDKNALGAGPGHETTTSVNRAPDHARGGAAAGHGPADAAVGGQDIAGDDMAGHGDHGRRGGTFWQRLASWLGRVHTAVIHFPIAMLIGAFALELLGVWRGRPQFRDVSRGMLVVGALGAVAAAALGWFAGGFYLTDRNPVLMIHRWLGTTLAVLTSILAYRAVTRSAAPGERSIVNLLSLGAIAAAVAVQGYLGGSFMHGGLDHLAF